ncbi:response regulator [Oceanospirillum beijerinckii]|uniref:response regulator n=1 Tax=Oceanospirillum beijerinckii TaxID=64976 RepID=UPI00040B8518|nr:response regulator [Oceanospirillum beijerinckii]MAC45809.1 DNA-binding response regulator [Oceanospirillum sp.]
MSEQIQKGCILLAEDDQKLGDQVQRFLERYDYQVIRVMDGLEAIEQIRIRQPDIVILDLMLPGADGFQVCREVRAGFFGQILILTASEDDMDQVAGLELGADGYLIKPIHPRVLLAHLRLLERNRQPAIASSTARTGEAFAINSDVGTVAAHVAVNSAPPIAEQTKWLTFGQLQIHPIQRAVTLAGDDIILTPSEFDVLLLLANQAEQVVSRDEILKTLRGIEYDGFDRSVDVKVSALRKKLADNLSQPRKIITVRAKGYLFVPDAWG